MYLFFYSEHGLLSQSENISFLLINPFIICPFELFSEISKPNGGGLCFQRECQLFFYFTEFVIHSRQNHTGIQQ